MPANRRQGSRFPDPRDAPPDGPLAWGGALDVDTMVDAYSRGIFPWPLDDDTVFWWSPDPRAVIPLGGVHISRSLRQTLRSGRFSCTRDTAFSDVVQACAQRRGDDGGTWIVPRLIDGYLALHEAGVAHSVEVWHDDRLAGGLFGITIGAAFTGESMFHLQPDASKVALVHLDEHLRGRGFAVLDVQLPTPHLESLGAVPVARAEFLRQLEDAVGRDVRW